MTSVIYQRATHENSFASVSNMICNRLHKETSASDLNQALTDARSIVTDFKFKPQPFINILDETNKKSRSALLISYRYICDLSNIKSGAHLELMFPNQSLDWAGLLILWLFSIPFAAVVHWYIRFMLRSMQREAARAVEALVKEHLDSGFQGDRKASPHDGIITRLIDNEIPALNAVRRHMTSLMAKVRMQAYRNFEIEKRAELGEFTVRVAHDISTPIEVISKVLEKPNSLPIEDKVALISSAQTLKESVQDISNRYKETMNPKIDVEVKKSLKLDFLSQQIQIVLGQVKNLWPEIVFEFQVDSENELPVKMNANLFQAAARNIIKNAIEAMQGAGKISINIERVDMKMKLTITDEGPGIPPEIADTIFDKGVSLKSSGSGFGLYNAKMAIGAFSGEINGSSKKGLGATFEITLPGQVVEHNALEIFYAPTTQIVVLDDDHFVHYVWEPILNGLGPGTRVHKFFNTTDFRNWYLKSKPDSNVIFLIDQEIKEKFRTSFGLDLIAELNIAPFSYLVTGLAQEEDIKLNAKSLGVPVMDKLDVNLAKFIPTQDMSGITHVLIDDAPANHRLWASKSQEKNIRSMSFFDEEEFLKVHHLFNRTTEVYVDLYLGDSAIGGDVARKIRGLGFRNVKIATAVHELMSDEFKGEFEVVSKIRPFSAEL